MGPYAIDGEKLDLTDPKVHEGLSGAVVDDVLYEFKCEDDIGYGIIESVVIIG